MLKVCGPRCLAVFWLGWWTGWQRSARSLVCTAGRSFHSGCCSAPSPPGLPGWPCPRCCGSWLPLGGSREEGKTDSSRKEPRIWTTGLKKKSLTLSVPARRGLYRSPEGVLVQRWLNLARRSLSVVSSSSSNFKAWMSRCTKQACWNDGILFNHQVNQCNKLQYNKFFDIFHGIIIAHSMDSLQFLNASTNCY